MYKYTYMYIYIYLYIYICMYIYIRVCISIYMYIYIFIYVSIYISLSRSPSLSLALPLSLSLSLSLSRLRIRRGVQNTKRNLQLPKRPIITLSKRLIRMCVKMLKECDIKVQVGEDLQDALNCRSFSAKEPLIIGLVSGQ